MLEIQVQEAKCLQRIFKRRTKIQMMEDMLGMKRCKMSRIASTPTENSQVFMKILRERDKIYAQVDSHFIEKGRRRLWQDLHTTKFFVACATEHEMDSLQATLDYIAGIDLPHTDVCAETELLAMIDEESALAFGDNIDHSSEDDASLATLDKLKRRVPSWKTSPCASRDDGCSFDDSAQCLEVSSQPIKRRQRGRSRKAELEDLRKLSAKLSDKIESMKASAAKVQEASKNDDGNAVVKTMWTDIALRQLMLRQAAEAINAKLRNDVVFHAKHAKNLKRMLKRRYSEEMLELMPIEKRARSIVSKTAAADQRVFRELMRDVNQVYTSVDTLVANKGMANLPCPGRDQKVNPKTVNGLFIELMDKNLVPFSTAQTSQAVWKAMCGQKTRDADIVDAKVCVQDTQQTDAIITSYMNYTCNAAGHSSFVQESRVGRKYVEADRVVFVFRCLTQPSSRSLGPLGLFFQETVVIVVRKGPTMASGQETTVIESYLWATRCDDGKEIALIFRDAVFVDIAIEGWNKKLSLYSERIENILFDDALNMPSQVLEG
ncbi:hypothetical protein PC113_g18026 [Phytophthora cactorum]|uniref:Uncharacterized protein n=1 Tax=Phytophthora cactorum TaxID=29920 RepID=A0A8T0YHB6_9STRA|nr:hypothetical protein PC113_g18026 [Phytophthora cactorum]